MKAQTTTIEFIELMQARNAKRHDANPWKARLGEHLARFIESIEATVAERLADPEFVEGLASVNRARDAEPPECELNPRETRDSRDHAVRAPESPSNAPEQNATPTTPEAV